MNSKTSSNQLLLSHHIAQKNLQINCFPWIQAQCHRVEAWGKGAQPNASTRRNTFWPFRGHLQPWKKVLRVSKLLGKIVSLFIKFLNFYSVSGFLILEALQVPISFPFSLSLFLLHFYFKLAISGLSLTPLSFISFHFRFAFPFYFIFLLFPWTLKWCARPSRTQNFFS